MSHPNPHDDPQNRYPSDDYKPVSKKKSMAKKMRKNQLPKWFKDSMDSTMNNLNKLSIRKK